VKECAVEKNLEFYVKVYNDHFSKESCKDIVNYLNNMDESNWIQHTYYDSVNKTTSAVSGDRELDVTNNMEPIIHNYVMDRYWQGFRQYLTELEFPWFSAWQAFSSARYNRYKENRVMNPHCDHIHTIFDGEQKGVPIMTALAIFNDDYVGGKFTLFEEKEIELKAGDLIIFPSNFLYPHRVDSVVSGTRYSAVTWAW
jgi:predicted 2-oxoglutarate/Fe(II)-dependent dioxygenase YbiX